MKPLINLASEPFRNRRLFWLSILLFFAVPSYLGLEAVGNMARLDSEISNLSAIVKGLEAQYEKVNKPVRNSVTISPDQNRELTAAGELVARRSFSWSQLLTDIERNLTENVRVLRVGVTQILPQERDGTIGGNEIAATLMFEVIGKTGQDVTAMINKFHESGRFKVFPLTKKPVEGTEEVEFTLRVDYFPPQPASRGSLSNQIASGQIAEKK
jgi:hypothetical protein